jgi:hypothetical protein
MDTAPGSTVTAPGSIDSALTWMSAHGLDAGACLTSSTRTGRERDP